MTTRCRTLAIAMPFCLMPCLMGARLHFSFKSAISSPNQNIFESYIPQSIQYIPCNWTKDSNWSIRLSSDATTTIRMVQVKKITFILKETISCLLCSRRTAVKVCPLTPKWTILQINFMWAEVHDLSPIGYTLFQNGVLQTFSWNHPCIWSTWSPRKRFGPTALR